MNAAEIRRTFAEQLSWSDEQLLEWAGGLVGAPKEEAGDSFVLHAPLELTARSALLARVPPGLRAGSRERIVWLVATYLDAGPSVTTREKSSHSSIETTVTRLLSALGRSELDEIDHCASWLERNAQPSELQRLLGPSIARSLSAAAHGSIALHFVGRIPALSGSLLRGILRELGRKPDVIIDVDDLAGGPRPLLEALLGAPLLGMPSSNFIYPMVANGERAARELLADVDADASEAMRSLTRVAAWSMIQDDPEHAPYGWTHTLTIPQAVMSLGLEPRLAVSIAASQVIGFRASMGTRHLDPSLFIPVPSDGGFSKLVAEASLHHDAHFVKYTLACHDASIADPKMAHLYLAAASKLAAWWKSQAQDDFFSPAPIWT